MPTPSSSTYSLFATAVVLAVARAASAQAPAPEMRDAPQAPGEAPSERVSPVTPPPEAVPPDASAPSAVEERASPVDSAPKPPSATQPAGETAASSPDLAEIEAALAQDASAAEAQPPPASEPASSLPATGGAGAGSSLNPDLSLILDTALAYFSEDDNLQTGGHDPTHTGFNLQQLELSASSIVDPYFRFDANIVFAQYGVEVEEAYGTTLALPARFQARFGQFLHRFGRINPTHPHSWEFVDQPFAVGRVFGGEGGRGLGAELSWLTPLPWYVELVGTATEASGESTARSFYGADDLGVEGLADFLYVTAIKQFFPLNDDLSLLWGLSAALGPNPTGRDNRTDIYGTDLYLKYRPVTRESQLRVAWQSEVFYRRRQIPEDLLQDVSLYTQLAVGLSKRWGLAGRYEFGSPARDLEGDTTAADGTGIDALDPEWTDNRHRFAANVTFWPTEFSRFRLQGSYDLPTWLDRGIWSTFLAAELAVGAHGAHQF